MKYARTLLLLAAAKCLATSAMAQTPASTGPTGPYDAVPQWLKPVAAGRVIYPISVFALSPDRVFISNKGSSPPPGNDHGFDAQYPGARVDHQFLVVDRNGRLVEEWSQWSGLFGSMHKIKINPYDPQKNVWVIDRVSQQILEFSPDGKKLLKAIGEKGVAGTDHGHFGRPTDIAWLPDGSFFVSDGYGNSRVVKFDRNGVYLGEWGTKGTGPGQFDEPHGVALDAQRRVYVVDRLNQRIQIFDENGKFLAQWRDFESPAAVMVTMDQSVWVLDNGRGQLRKFSPDGKLLSAWGTKGGFPGGMADPHDFWVDDTGILYVSNGHGHRVDKYVPRAGVDPALLVGQPYVATAAGKAVGSAAPAPLPNVADTAVDISKAQLAALAALPSGDHQARVVDVGKSNVAVGVVTRNAGRDQPGDPIRGIAHDSTTEVYYILSGAGLLTTGGTIIDGRRASADSEIVKVLNGPSVNGTSRGGTTRRVGPGDMIVIPAGMFHGWSQIEDHVTYVTVRPDPERVLPAGYVNPVLTK